MVGDVILWLLWPVAAVNVGVLCGAEFWADHRKTSGESPTSLPGFMTLADWLGLEMLGRIYSDLHRRYESRFISSCIVIARITMPLTFALIVANGVVLIAGL